MVALGENKTSFLKKCLKIYIDPAQLTRVQGLFFQVAESLGLSSHKAYTLSENFAKLSSDLASFL